MSEAIFVEGLTKRYGDKTVVNHLDLSVKRGTVFGLLGANGTIEQAKAQCGVERFEDVYLKLSDEEADE